MECDTPQRGVLSPAGARPSGSPALQIKEHVMNKFLERLNAGEVLVADGATGSNLQKMGLKPGRPPEDLVIDNPDILLKLAGSFVEAGSDIILTCTFGGTRLRMKDSKYQDRTPEVNIRAAELARQAASARD